MTLFTISKTIHLAIIDDEILFRRGMAQVLDEVDNMQLIQEANHSAELIKELKKSRYIPQVILYGLRGKSQKDLDEVHLITQNYPESKLITLSTECPKAFILQLLQLGVASCLPKNASPIKIENTIRTVLEKGFFYNERVLEVMRENLTKKMQQKSPGRNMPLSAREKDVLKLICEQYTNTEIAEVLNLSSRTVEWHRVNLLRKLKCRNTAGLVALTIQRELVHVDFSKFEE